MDSKLTSFIKMALLVWIGILLPLTASFMFIKSSMKNDILREVDTFLETENANLGKYFGLQFETVYHDIQKLGAFVESCDNAKNMKTCIDEYVKNHQGTQYVHVYDQTGKLIANSQEKGDVSSLSKEELECKSNEVMFTLFPSSDGTVSLIMLLAQQKPNAKEKGFVKLAVDWKIFERYLKSIAIGPFPRMFYVIPQTTALTRYVSRTSLLDGGLSQRDMANLGLHLFERKSSLVNGLSSFTIKCDDGPRNFRLVKSEIKIPEKMHGTKLFLVSVMDNATLEVVRDGFLRGVPAASGMLIAVILGISLFISRKYNRINGDLAVANKISDSTPLAITVFRADTGKIQKINLTARTLLRIQEENIERVNMWDFFVSDSDREYVKNAIQSDLNVFNYEVLGQSFGGAPFWSVCSVSPVIIDEVKYIMLGVLDINRRKEVEKKLANNAEMLERQVAERTADLEKNAAQLQAANAELERAKAEADTANNAKSSFLTNVSNELKTPLNAIIGYSEILQEEAQDRKDNVTADDLRKIIGAARHLLSLINEILDLSQIEAGKIQLFFEIFSVQDMMKDVESVIMPMVTDNNNSLYLEYSKDVGTMNTDSTKLRQCLLNLLSNAAKFTEFGKITLRASVTVVQGEDFIEFAVIDTGKGIAEDRLPTIFDAFQVESSQNSGTGLGLAVTKEYTGYLGGDVSVESEVGVGSKFVIKIPRICKTKSTDKITVKNDHEDKELEEFIEETEKSIEHIEEEEKELKDLEKELEKEEVEFEKDL